MKIDGQAVSLAMLKAGISHQKELSERTGISTTSLSLMMRGATTPKLETIGRVASALGVEPSEIIKEE